MRSIDIGTVLDEGRWSGYQKLITRIGSRITMPAMCVDAVARALLVRSLGDVQPTLGVFALLAWTGGLINGTQTTM